MSFTPLPTAVTAGNALTFCTDPALAAAFTELNSQLIQLYSANSLGPAPALPTAPFGERYYIDSVIDTVLVTLQTAVNALLVALSEPATCPDLRQYPLTDTERYVGIHSNTGTQRLSDSFTAANGFLSPIWTASGLP